MIISEELHEAIGITAKQKFMTRKGYVTSQIMADPDLKKNLRKIQNDNDTD